MLDYPKEEVSICEPIKIRIVKKIACGGRSLYNFFDILYKNSKLMVSIY